MSVERPDIRVRFARLLLLAWFLGIALAPGERPLDAPRTVVGLVHRVAGIAEIHALTIVSFGFWIIGIGVLGILTALAFGDRHWGRRSLVVLGLAPLFAIAALSLNQGYFPISVQLKIGGVSAFLGALFGMGLLKNRSAGLLFVTSSVGILFWFSFWGIDDDLSTKTRRVASHLMADISSVPSGDKGFVFLVEEAFAFAVEDSDGSDLVETNGAAILALGVLLGDEAVAKLAWRPVDEDALPHISKLRRRIKAYRRGDWSRHFWVSAALTVLSDEECSMAVGLAKELMDSVPGGVGFPSQI